MTERQSPLELRKRRVDVCGDHERRVRFKQDARSRSVRARGAGSGHLTHECAGVEVRRVGDDACDADVEVWKVG